MLDGWEIKSKRPDGDGTDMMEKEGQYMCKRVELPDRRPRPKRSDMKGLQMRFKLANVWIRIQIFCFALLLYDGLRFSTRCCEMAAHRDLRGNPRGSIQFDLGLIET